MDGGLVRYALANNPLPMHPNADWLARMALCAGEQGRYWDIHHGLFAPKPASHPAAIALADPLDLDRSRLQDCADADSAAHRDIIERDQELARRLGLVGTPAFAVGRVEGGQRVHVQKLIRGALPFDVFRDVIEEVVERAS